MARWAIGYVLLGRGVLNEATAELTAALEFGERSEAISLIPPGSTRRTDQHPLQRSNHRVAVISHGCFGKRRCQDSLPWTATIDQDSTAQAHPDKTKARHL